jgi:Fic family protein
MALFTQNLKIIDEQRKILNSLSPIKKEYQQLIDTKFRLEFNFNSNHLEGNTLTYSETELLLIFDQTQGGHELREYEEMKAHDVALKMIKDEAADQERPLTENFIRTLNQYLLVRPFWKEAITESGESTKKQIIPGQYKTSPNSVRLTNGEIFHYASPSEVPIQMEELVNWYNQNSASEDPIILASLLHYKFVRIHPFDDGNGRVARLLMNYVLLKHNYPLVVIKSSEKKDYLTALNQADIGNTDAFIRYISERALWSIDIYIKAGRGENIDEEEDLDKELELLKKNLNNIPDEFDKRMSIENLHSILNDSIIKLFFSLHDKLDQVRDLFVEINEELMVDLQLEKNVYKRKKSFQDIGTINNITVGNVKFRELLIKGIAIDINFLALKKVSTPTNFKIRIDVIMEEYHYYIIDEEGPELLIKLPYGRFFSERNIKEIVNRYIRRIIGLIKEQTNIK